ncbi:uncharacterized protein [Chelonus insularis]|uniref:uncharacterized protein n=1 Tax=Chelonus insularis TaxID=460826 RepID=UPI00158C435C|nr:uncharacterized protein LOC118068416 [Chelonus insularis]
MDKQRNRDNRRQKQKLNAKKNRRVTPQTVPSQEKNAPVVRNESSSDESDDVYDMFDYVNQNFVQPKSRYANNPEGDSKSTIDFEDLANAAVSCAYFQFKSEKNWTEDISKYSELLAIDIRNLETIVDCIPYHQLVEVDDTYFTEDQLTYFNSRAEQSEKSYEIELLEREKIRERDCRNDDIIKNKKKNSEVNETEKVDDDLDFLLSLKEPEPIKLTPVANTFSMSKTNEEQKVSKSTSNTNSIDLEKWLDSVLDL